MTSRDEVNFYHLQEPALHPSSALLAYLMSSRPQSREPQAPDDTQLSSDTHAMFRLRFVCPHHDDYPLHHETSKTIGAIEKLHIGDWTRRFFLDPLICTDIAEDESGLYSRWVDNITSTQAA